MWLHRLFASKWWFIPDLRQIEFGRYPYSPKSDGGSSITLPMLMSSFTMTAPFTEKFANQIPQAVSPVFLQYCCSLILNVEREINNSPNALFVELSSREYGICNVTIAHYASCWLIRNDCENRQITSHYDLSFSPNPRSIMFVFRPLRHYPSSSIHSLPRPSCQMLMELLIPISNQAISGA